MAEQRILPAHVLYEDNHLIAINKLSGVLVQGDSTGDQALSEGLAEFLKIKYDKPGNVFVGVIHRIDRPVSGLVLFAKTSKALSRMNRLFQERSVQKTYLAIVEGLVEDEKMHLCHYLQKDGKKNQARISLHEKKDFKKAELDFKLVKHLDRYSVLEISPKTGRHHQIRAQLSAYGHPIKGDLKYGAKRSNADGSISLHSRRLEFLHPVKLNQLRLEAPLPLSDLWEKVIF